MHNHGNNCFASKFQVSDLLFNKRDPHSHEHRKAIEVALQDFFVCSHKCDEAVQFMQLNGENGFSQFASTIRILQFQHFASV